MIIINVHYLWFVSGVFKVCLCDWLIVLEQCVGVCLINIFSVGDFSLHLSLYVISLSRLQKTLLEKEDGERKLKELQDSMLTMKKQVPSSDSSARVIHISVAGRNSDYVYCVVETESIACVL